MRVLRCARARPPQIHPPLTSHAPASPAADHVCRKKSGNLYGNDLYFDFHDIAMKRSNTGVSGKQKFSLTTAHVDAAHGVVDCATSPR